VNANGAKHEGKSSTQREEEKNKKRCGELQKIVVNAGGQGAIKTRDAKENQNA